MAEPNWWESDPVAQPATMPNPQVPVQSQQPPAFIPGTPKPISPIEQRRLEMEEIRLQMAQDKAASEQITPAQSAVDREFGKEYVEWAVKGGRADYEKSVTQLRDALNTLRTSDNITGPVVGRIPDAVSAFTNPDRINTREQVEEIVQRNLRLILGAQFTEKEGERLIARAYNPTLDEATNARRVELLLKQIQGAAEAKDAAARYYEENGTMLGYQGALPTMADIERGLDEAPGGGEEQDNPFAGIIGQDGQPLGPEGGYGQDAETGEWGMYSRTSDDSPATVDPRITTEAARQDELRGKTNLIDLAGHGMTLGLTDEASGVGQAIAGALKGDFDIAENYAFGRDVEQYRIDQARERYGTLGTVAEVAGGMGLPAGALARSGKVADAARGGATAGAIGGFGYGQGTEESLINAGIGAVGGAALGAGAQRLGNAALARTARPAAQVQRAADDLGIDTIPAVTGGPVTRAMTAGAKQGFVSERPITAATDRMASQAQSARSTIAQSTGQVREADEAGELVRKAANVYSKRTSQIGGSLYTRADRMAGGVKAPLPKAIQEADNAMAEIAESVGGKDSALYKDLAALRSQMADGEFSIPGIRATRTRLREEMTERGLRGSYSDVLYGKILNAAEDDMIAGLQAAGKDNAVGAMKTASAFWRARVEAIDEVLDPLLGKNAPRSGEQILSALERMAKPDTGNARNLARLMRALPKDEANSVRATVINRLGRPTKGSGQAQDGFSFDTFMTNWNNMSMPAKRTMFPGETIEALEKMATVSQKMKQAGMASNTSNTARALGVQAAISTPLIWLAEPMTAVGVIGGQYAAGKLLASPRFARMLAGAPRNASAAGQRAWAKSLGQIAKAEPAIAKEIKLFQDAVTRAANDNPAMSTIAAQDDQQGN